VELQSCDTGLPAATHQKVGKKKDLFDRKVGKSRNFFDKKVGIVGIV